MHTSKTSTKLLSGIQQVLAGKDVDMNDPDAVFCWRSRMFSITRQSMLFVTWDLFTSQEYQVLEKAAQNTKRVGEEETYFEFCSKNLQKAVGTELVRWKRPLLSLSDRNTDLGR